MKKYTPIAFLLFTVNVFAQCGNTLSNLPCSSVPAPSGQNAIYRCGNSYSNVPCVGAKEVDQSISRGLDSWTGDRRVSHENRHDDIWQNVHKALGTLSQSVGTPKSNETYEESKRRRNLTYEQRVECRRLKEQFKKNMTDDELYNLRLSYSRC